MGWLFNKERTNPSASRRTYSRTRLWSGSTNTTATSQRRASCCLLSSVGCGPELARCRYRLLLGLVCVSLVHHVTFSINRSATWWGTDRSTRATRLPTSGPWPSFSFGESWHNSHHTDPELCSSRRSEATDRHHREIDLDLREAGLGLERQMAPDGQVRLQASGILGPLSTKPGERRGG